MSAAAEIPSQPDGLAAVVAVSDQSRARYQASNDTETVPEPMHNASESDVARNKYAAFVAQSTLNVVARVDEQDRLRRLTAAPKALLRVEPVQATSTVAIGGSKMYRARSMWEAGSQDWSLCVEFAKVDGAEPQWQPWKLQLETQLEPRTLAIAPLERHICVCGEGFGEQSSAAGVCLVIACRPDQDGIHRSWQIPSHQGPPVRHAAWHPLSGNHLVVLSADNVIRVYNTSNSMTEPEQAIELCDNDEDDELITFCFADVPLVAAHTAAIASHGWEHMTLYALSRRGMIFGACPVMPYDSFIPLALLANAAQQTTQRHAASIDDPSTIQEASWLAAVSAESYKRLVAVTTGQHCADHSAIRVRKPSSMEHRQVQLQRLCEGGTDAEWCGLACLHGDTDIAVAARISTSGRLKIMLSMSHVQPRWQQYRRSSKATTQFSDFEEHDLGSTEHMHPETLSQLHGKTWKQRECALVSRDNRWSMEIRESGECTMTAHLQDVRLTEQYDQSQLPDEAQKEAKFAFSLEGRVWDRRREHFVFTKWVFCTGTEQTRIKWTDRLAEKIAIASNFDSFPPFHLQSSRVSHGLLVAGPQGWHAVSFPWIGELDTADAADSTGENEDTNQLELSPSHLEHTSCERICGCIVAASVAQRKRLGADFCVLAGRQSATAKVKYGNFWTPTAAVETEDAGEKWTERIDALCDNVSPPIPPGQSAAIDVKLLADFGPTYSAIRAWKETAGSADSNSKLVASRMYLFCMCTVASSFALRNVFHAYCDCSICLPCANADVGSTEIVAQQRALQEWSASCAKKTETVQEIGERIASLDGVREQIAASCNVLKDAQKKNLEVTQRCLNLLRRYVRIFACS